MDMLQGLNEAIQYLEGTLDNEPDISRASQLAGLTQDSFCRFFSYMTGITVNEYIRRRRLTLAAQTLNENGGKVIDAAMAYGFQSADTFSKAFIRQHGIPPTRARESGAALRIYPPVSFHISVRGAREMNFKLIELRGTALRGISEPCEGAAAERFAQENTMWSLNQDQTMQRICTEGPGIWYGVWNQGRYWIAKPEMEANYATTEPVNVPAGLYAVFTTQRGGRAGDELSKLRQLVFDSWLPSSGYRQTADFELEVYHLYPLEPNEARLRRYYELWIPVTKE